MPAETSVDAIDIALRVGRAIEEAGGEYFVGGSLASSMQGEPRATNDIDVVVSLPVGRLRALVERLGADFEVDLDALREAMLRGGCCNVFYLPLLTKVDLFALGAEAFDEAEFGRRRAVQVRATGERLVVKSPEDTVLRKLLWFRAGGEVSERQWRDVVQVLRVSGPELDDGYLDRWAATLRIESLLGRARGDASGVR